MIFVYKQWDIFCRNLKDNGFISISASAVLKRKDGKSFLVLKHDVETSLSKALILAQIENKYSHHGSYYIHGSLLNNKENIGIMKHIQKLGHEVSYHHDVMDSNGGDINKAKAEFQRNKDTFEKNGFFLETVCQHGNPIVERVGYSSNRDFFRNKEVAKLYEHISEIMVTFRSRIEKNYKYISDAGYGWKLICDPENNDLITSTSKDVPLANLDSVFNIVKKGDSVIISTHPHRWHSNAVKAKVYLTLFRFVKNTVMYIWKIPGIKKFMGRFYCLAIKRKSLQKHY